MAGDELVLAGGLLYTVGAVCDLVRWPVVSGRPVRVGPHEVFHLAVMTASFAFFVFVVRHVLPYAPDGGSPGVGNGGGFPANRGA